MERATQGRSLHRETKSTVEKSAAAAVCLFHVLAAETPAEGSCRQHRRRMGECFWLVLDAADAAAGAVLA
jgi:hypothetical protein